MIEEGNTSIIAHMIAEQTRADLFEIEPVTPYPESHSELLAVTFLEQLDWTGKRIIPFCTNEGSGLGQSEAAIRVACKGAEVAEGVSFSLEL